MSLDPDRNRSTENIIRAALTDAVRANPAQAPMPPSPPRPSTPSPHGTDLPHPQSGSGGSGAGDEQAPRRATSADLIDAIQHTLLVPVAPPLHEVSARAVVAWAEEAAQALVLRRERRRLIREVLAVLEEEWVTRQQLERLADQIEAREQDRRDRTDGTYWQRRESGRRSQQAIRVDVEPEAWRRAGAIARQRRIGLGEYVAELVRAAVDGDVAITTRSMSRRRERFFARIAVEPATWRCFVAGARERRITAARLVGILVESAAADGSDGHRQR